MMSLDILVALALLGLFFWALAALTAYWRKSMATDSHRELPDSVRGYTEQGDFFYHRFRWRVRTVISIASLFPQQHYAQNRAGITLCFVTAFVQSMYMLRPGVMSNTAAGWAHWTQSGLSYTFGEHRMHKPISRTLVAAASRADRHFLLEAMRDPIHRKLSSVEHSP